QGELDERVVGGLVHGTDGGGDAAARLCDGEVIGAGAAQGELVRAVTGPDEVGVRVDEAGCDQASPGVEDLRARSDALARKVTFGSDPRDVRVLDADHAPRDGREELLGAAAVRTVGGVERPGVPDEKVEGAAHWRAGAFRPERSFPAVWREQRIIASIARV